jgi:hypothetical protein
VISLESDYLAIDCIGVWDKIALIMNSWCTHDCTSTWLLPFSLTALADPVSSPSGEPDLTDPASPLASFWLSLLSCEAPLL